MSDQTLNIYVIVVLVCLSWYYHSKHIEKQKYCVILLESNKRLREENNILKSRIKDLQLYRDDVSKTFNILDNEMLMIKEHIKSQQENDEANETPIQILPLPSTNEEVSSPPNKYDDMIEEI